MRSLGAGGQRVLDRDQVQWITGSGTDQDQGITGRQTRGRLDPDQVHGITGRQAGSTSSTRTKSSGSLGAYRLKREDRRRQGKDGGNPKTVYAPPVSKDAADRVQHPCRCVQGQTLRIKLHIVRPELVRYACHLGKGFTYRQNLQ